MNDSERLLKRVENRENWFREMLNRWQAASGAEPINETRAAQMLNELDLIEYSEAQAKRAERWILFGKPATFGILILSDFDPTNEQLATLPDGARCTECADRYKAGFDAGYSKGRIDEAEAVKENAEYVGLIERNTKNVDMHVKELELNSREKSLNEREESLNKRESELNRAERVNEKRNRYYQTQEER